MTRPDPAKEVPEELPECPPEFVRQIARARRPDGRIDAKSLQREALLWVVAGVGKETYRSKALFKFFWQRDGRTLADLPMVTRLAKERLEERVYIHSLQPAGRLASADGTTKFLWQTEDGHAIESVLIPDEDRPGPNPARYTLCVSTQVGCAMACSFCLTGDLGLKRNLTAGEICDQALQVQSSLPAGIRLTNIVMMGMGEPLHNYDNVLVALRILLDEDGLNFSHRRITVSTVGLVPRLRQLVDESPVNIAVSLNATTEEQRLQVMPITRKYSMTELMDTCRSLPIASSKRITFEYVMMAGFNDAMEDAERLRLLMQGVPAKVNLIPYNENPDRDIRRPSDERVKAFQHHLVSQGVNCSIRTTRGRDVSAACGQLGKAVERMAAALRTPAATSRAVALPNPTEIQDRGPQ